MNKPLSETTIELSVKTVRQLNVRAPDLDLVTVIVEDIEPGRGGITITCWGQAWSNYWGAMGKTTSMSDFFRRASVDYLAGKLGNGMKDEVYDAQHSEEACKREVIRQRRAGDLQKNMARHLWQTIDHTEFYDDMAANHDILSEVFGDDWWLCAPMKPNPDWAYLCKIVDAVKQAFSVEADHLKELSILVPSAELTDAASDVLAERRRQITHEGWALERDDQYTDFSLSRAAAAYAVAASVTDSADRSVMDSSGDGGGVTAEILRIWPESWARDWLKPKNRRADLVKSGALILAEIERLDRAKMRAGKECGAA